MFLDICRVWNYDGGVILSWDDDGGCLVDVICEGEMRVMGFWVQETVVYWNL